MTSSKRTFFSVVYPYLHIQVIVNLISTYFPALITFFVLKILPFGVFEVGALKNKGNQGYLQQGMIEWRLQQMQASRGDNVQSP